MLQISSLDDERLNLPDQDEEMRRLMVANRNGLDFNGILVILAVMDVDEREIFLFLKTYGADYVALREVCRRAGGRRRYDEDHEWAKPILIRMAERGILETNAAGQYRVKPAAKKKKGSRWVAPDIAKILQESGVAPEEAASDIASDEYYEQL